MLKRFLARSVIALTMLGPATAGPYEDGYAAYESKDYATAYQRWQPLAEQGHAEAQIGLGLMYAMGTGVARDPVQAYVWLDIAAGSGGLHAGAVYADAVGYRDMVAAEMSPDQIAEAQRLSLEWLPAR